MIVLAAAMVPPADAFGQAPPSGPAQPAALAPAAPAGPAESVYQKNTAPPAVPAADQAAQAERIVAASLAALGRAESISARVRERV
ncbi:MAG: hypothetical protein HQ464_07665, partial [Planctomycetes bacterium]|nr:hypothetical protein [Planctomycetota bacterium]